MTKPSDKHTYIKINIDSIIGLINQLLIHSVMEKKSQEYLDGIIASIELLKQTKKQKTESANRKAT